MLGIAQRGRGLSESRELRPLPRPAQSDTDQPNARCWSASARRRAAAIPLSLVDRLEEIPLGQQVARGAEQEVVQYRGRHPAA